MTVEPPNAAPAIDQLRTFLEAALTGEESCARAAGHGFGHQPLGATRNAGWTDLDDRDNVRLSYDVNLVGLFSPDRVLAECAAKRDTIRAVAGTAAEETVLRALAAPYRDRRGHGDWDNLERHQRPGSLTVSCTICGEFTMIPDRDFAQYTTAAWETGHAHQGQL